MLFKDYVLNEMTESNTLNEAIKKVGRDFRDGQLRNNHVESDKENREIIWINGIPIEKIVSSIEKKNRKRAQSRFGQQKRNRKMAQIQAKRKRTFKRRRLMNMEYKPDIKQPSGNPHD